LVSLEEIYSGGKKMDVSEKRAVEGQRIVRWKELSMKKLKIKN
jgi:hypothetical protein